MKQAFACFHQVKNASETSSYSKVTPLLTLFGNVHYFSKFKFRFAHFHQEKYAKYAKFSGLCVLFNLKLSRFNAEGGILNPRTAINSLLPFQGSPFNHLGTSAWLRVILLLFTSLLLGKKEAERVGFEPTRPCGQTVFKTASL